MSIRLPLVVLGGLALAGGAAAWKMGTDRPAARLTQPVPASAKFAPASGEQAPASGDPAAGSAEHVEVGTGPRRWFSARFLAGRPGAGDKIPARRAARWIDATTAVKNGSGLSRSRRARNSSSLAPEDNPFRAHSSRRPRPEGARAHVPARVVSAGGIARGVRPISPPRGAPRGFHDQKSNPDFSPRTPAPVSPPPYAEPRLMASMQSNPNLPDEQSISRCV